MCARVCVTLHHVGALQKLATRTWAAYPTVRRCPTKQQNSILCLCLCVCICGKAPRRSDDAPPFSLRRSYDGRNVGKTGAAPAPGPQGPVPGLAPGPMSRTDCSAVWQTPQPKMAVRTAHGRVRQPQPPQAATVAHQPSRRSRHTGPGSRTQGGATGQWGTARWPGPGPADVPIPASHR